LFVPFDIEVIFLYPWAINFKELGMEGMVKMVVFMSLLLVGFSTSRRKPRVGIKKIFLNIESLDRQSKS
jgi:NADH:ubiquinone oxidoreductase subunit 3 (subunit A)